MSFMVFVIHTVPDTHTGSKKYQFGDLDEKNAIKAMTHLQQQSGRQDLPQFLQRVVAISSIYRGPGVTLEMSYLGDGKSEDEILYKFFKSINPNNLPTFVTWDSSNDISILKYRCLKHVLPISLLTMNPPVSLKDELSEYNDEASTSLENLMYLIGKEGSKPLNQQQIWDCWWQKDFVSIRRNCIDRALDLYLVYLRYQYIKGETTLQYYEHEVSHFDRFTKQYIEKYVDI